MSESITINQQIFNEIQRDIARTKMWGFTFVISGISLQVLNIILPTIQIFSSMIIITGIILIVGGLLFFIGTRSVPNNPESVIKRLRAIMINKDPKRRLWASQRYVGYLKEANFPKEFILSEASQIASIVHKPPVLPKFQPYVAVDHIVVLREMAVNVPMNKHVRKEFIKFIRPLRKIEGFPEEAYSLIMDTIGFHPSKLAVQAYGDLMKEEENKVE